MSIMRSALLWASANPTLKEKVPKLKFVQKALKRFMPGENIEDAVIAAKKNMVDCIPTVFTKLGENLVNLSEAVEVKKHYLGLIEKIANEKINVEVSLKLTQLGFDLSVEDTYRNFIEIVQNAKTAQNRNFFHSKSCVVLEKICKKKFNVKRAIEWLMYGN